MTDYCRCGEEAVAGVDDEGTVVWLCVDHFAAWLQEVREMIDRAAR